MANIQTKNVKIFGFKRKILYYSNVVVKHVSLARFLLYTRHNNKV